MRSQNLVEFCLGKQYGTVITLQARLYNEQRDLPELLISVTPMHVLEPALGVRLVCIIPPSLLAIIGTAEILNTSLFSSA